MRVFLRAFNKSDGEKVYKWLLDDEVQSLFGGDTFYPSQDFVSKWIEEKIFDRKNIYLAICLSETKEIIGYLSIKDIDHRNRKALWTGLIIGEKELWGKGLATEAANLMVKYLFDELNMNMIWGFWLEEHTASIKMGEKAGFRKIGVLPQAVYKKGKYHNMIISCLLREDYEGGGAK